MLSTNMLHIQSTVKDGCKPNHGGFTLVELLVTLILVSIVVSFAIPGFKKTIETSDVNNMRSDFIIFEKLLKNYYINTGDESDFVKGICADGGANVTITDADMAALNDRIGANFTKIRYDITCREPSARDITIGFRYSGSTMTRWAAVRVETDANDNVIRWEPSCTFSLNCPY